MKTFRAVKERQSCELRLLVPACEDGSHGCAEEALGLNRVELDLLAHEDRVTVANRDQGAHDSLDRLFHRRPVEARVGGAGSGVGECLGGQCVERRSAVGVVVKLTERRRLGLEEGSAATASVFRDGARAR